MTSRTERDARPQPGPQPPSVVQDCHALLLWMIPQLDKFPRQRRYTLGERIENELLEVLASCTSAAYSRQKVHFLTTASQRISVAQHLWRLAWELKVIAAKQYQTGSRHMVNLGAQIGGWLKASQRQQ